VLARQKRKKEGTVRRWIRLRKKSWVRFGCVNCLHLVFGSLAGCAWDDTMILGKGGVVEYSVFLPSSIPRLSTVFAILISHSLDSLIRGRSGFMRSSLIATSPSLPPYSALRQSFAAQSLGT
jgi:hypothetical protein